MKSLLTLSFILFAVAACSEKPVATEEAHTKNTPVVVAATPSSSANSEASAEDIMDPALAIQKIGEIKDDLYDHKAEALENARNLLGRLELARDSVTRKKELHAIISLAVLILPEDDSGEISDYIHDFHRDYTDDFDSVLQDTNKESRDLIRDSLAASKKLFDQGEEETPTSAKSPDEE